jgi:hypothetical protein
MRKNSELIAQHSALLWGGAMKNILSIPLIIATIVVGALADAQQAGKIVRIGFLDSIAPLPVARSSLKRFGRS